MADFEGFKKFVHIRKDNVETLTDALAMIAEQVSQEELTRVEIHITSIDEEDRYVVHIEGEVKDGGTSQRHSERAGTGS